MRIILPPDADRRLVLTPRTRRVLLWSAGLLVLVLAIRTGLRFPWQETFAAITGADPTALTGLAVISLLTFVAKAWAWHLLLRPVAPHSWSAAQDANLVGAAVNNLSVAVVGEAARVRRLQTLSGVPIAMGVVSVVWARTMEGIGLAVFVLVMPFVIDLPPLLQGLNLGAAVILVGLGALVAFRGWTKLPERVPAPIRRGLAVIGQIGPWPRLIVPLGLEIANWVGQWATMELALRAAHLDVPIQASLAVMLLTNLTGLLRLTPANLGAMQAGFVAGLLPFGIAAAPAVGASLLLQAAQILPVMVIALVLTGWKGLRELVRAGPPPAAG